MARKELKPRLPFRKYAGETCIWTLDLSHWLATGETISTVTFEESTPASLVTSSTPLQIDQEATDGTSITFRALAGDYDEDADRGEEYCVRFEITTSTGQVLHPSPDVVIEGC